MKRDMDLIRKILLELESSSESWAERLDGYEKQEIYHHAYLLIQAGLAEGNIFSSSPPPQADLFNLTWQGHEFIDSVRNESVWRKTREYIKEKGGSATFNLITQVASLFIKSQLEL